MPVSQASLNRLNETIVFGCNQILNSRAYRVNSRKNGTHNQTNTPNNPNDECKWHKSRNHKELDNPLLMIKFHWLD